MTHTLLRAKRVCEKILNKTKTSETQKHFFLCKKAKIFQDEREKNFTFNFGSWEIYVAAPRLKMHREIVKKNVHSLDVAQFALQLVSLGQGLQLAPGSGIAGRRRFWKKSKFEKRRVSHCHHLVQCSFQGLNRAGENVGSPTGFADDISSCWCHLDYLLRRLNEQLRMKNRT